MDITVPIDVPTDKRELYKENIKKATQSEHGRLMLFAGDQKIEHMNKDFFGEGIPEENNHPDHLFKIAAQGRVGVFATQFGMLAHYADDYPDVNYVVKMNSKSNLVKKDQADPLSRSLVSIDDVIRLRDDNNLSIVGVGYTVYLGSEHENEMLSEAAQLVADAHKHGLFTVLWMYPRGKAVTEEKNPHLIAGAAGVACCLGADFAKVNNPHSEGEKPEELLKEAVAAAGRTKIIVSGGSSIEPKEFLTELHEQIHVGGAMGNATGRNIHQKSLEEAVRFTQAISAITIDNKTVEEAMEIYEG